MAEKLPSTQVHSITDVATASWYAHRTSTPSANPTQSPSIRKPTVQAIGYDETRGQSSTSQLPLVAAASPSSSSISSTSSSDSSSSAASASPIPSSMYPATAEALASVASQALSSSAPTSDPGNNEVQVSRDEVSRDEVSEDEMSEDEVPGDEVPGDEVPGDEIPGDEVPRVEPSSNVGVSSDITAWQSALQSLPPEFANCSLPSYPLTQVLADQPTLRPVEWNQYRQQGGFVPRTPHDYSSLMIFISGQVNPNPCRNCLLRNGPFARCVVSPPAVLAYTALRHACANCTYQNQYKKCTNEPISEQERARSELSRPPLHPVQRSTVPRKPKPNNRTKHPLDKQKLPKRKRQKQELEESRNASTTTTQSQASIGQALGMNLASFDDKIQHIRACSPRSRRRLAADTLQWQAAIATVEAEGYVPAPDGLRTGGVPEPTGSQQALPLPSNDVPSRPAATYLATFAAPLFTAPVSNGNPSAIGRLINQPKGFIHEPMDEDVSGSEEEIQYEGRSWVAANHTEPMIKPPQ